jgi:predicted alpha/beta hydrolase
MKASISVEDLSPWDLTSYARVCGWTLARAHARSGDPVALAEYLGEDNAFDRSIAKFARRYADQPERDYEAFLAAIRSGHPQAQERV